MNVFGFAFAIRDGQKVLMVYSSIYYVVHILLFAFIFCGPRLIPKLREGQGAAVKKTQ